MATVCAFGRRDIGRSDGLWSGVAGVASGLPWGNSAVCTKVEDENYVAILRYIPHTRLHLRFTRRQRTIAVVHSRVKRL